jgi:ribosomal protein S18 acetylase RimI-like enzyme
LSRAGRFRARVEVRPARPEDVSELVDIENASFATDRLDRRALRYAIRSPTILACVAAEPENGKVLGYALVQIRRGSAFGWLTSLAVRPDSQGGGLGRQLIEAAERAAREAGRARIRLEVRADNAPARKLYEEAGYARGDELPDYYEDGAAALRYEKTLA